jgi:putative copper export protein
MTADGSTVLYAAARWLCYLAAFFVVGVVVFRLAVLPRAAGTDRAARAALDRRAVGTALVAALILFGTHLLRLYSQARSLIDPEERVTLSLAADILGTKWGHGWIAQAVAALVAAAGAALARRTRAGNWILGLGALGIILAAPRTGHAVALPQAGKLGYPLDLLHFGFGAAWLGTLGVMLQIGLTGPLRDRITPRRLVTAFSPVALVSGVAAIGLGLLIAWRYLGGLSPFFHSLYGRTVLIKLVTLGGVAALGAYNWKVVQPRLRRDERALVERSAGLEVVVGIVLIAITAVLVSLPLPGEE